MKIETKIAAAAAALWIAGLAYAIHAYRAEAAHCDVCTHWIGNCPSHR